MKKMALVIMLFTLLAAGCAPKMIHIVNPKYPDGSPAEKEAYNKDSYECEKDTAMLPSRHSYPPGSVDSAMENIGENAYRRDFFFRCLQSKGWTVVK